jgi:hypothetical protein
VTATSQVRALVMSEQEFRSMAAVLPNVADRIRAACDRRAKTLEAPPAG